MVYDRRDWANCAALGRGRLSAVVDGTVIFRVVDVPTCFFVLLAAAMVLMTSRDGARAALLMRLSTWTGIEKVAVELRQPLKELTPSAISRMPLWWSWFVVALVLESEQLLVELSPQVR